MQIGVLRGLEACATASCRPREVFESMDCQENVPEICINRDGYSSAASWHYSRASLCRVMAELTAIQFVC